MNMNKVLFLTAAIGCALGLSVHCMRRARATLALHCHPQPHSQIAKEQIKSPKSNVPQLPRSSDFPIPASLKQCGLDVRHIRTGGQTGATCGAHAAVNARAVQQIVQSGGDGQLTGAEIRSKAAALKSYIQQENLYYDDIYHLAGRIGLDNYLVMAFNNQMGNFYEATHSDSLGVQKSLNRIFSTIQSSAAGDYHFILNTGGHWVVVSVIKYRDQSPQMLYLDSGNQQLAEGSLGTSFIKYLITSIFKI